MKNNIIQLNWDLISNKIDVSCEVDDIEESYYDDNIFIADDEEWMVLTNSEANEKASEVIKDLVWSFNSSFLSQETCIDEEVFKAIQSNNNCEDNNLAMLSIIKATCGLDEFIESAISSDGRGHSLSNYDGQEIEVEINSKYYYFYRVN